MDNHTDLYIIDRIQSGEQTAFVELLQKYQAAIHGYAYHLTQNEFAAEEVTQETFVAAYFNLQTLRDAQNLSAWFRSITYHKSMDWLNQHHEAIPLTDTPFADQHSILENLERKEIYQVLSHVMRTLSEPSRIVMTLKIEGLKNSQIADFLELSQNVVDNRVYRAQKQLQERVLKILEIGFPKLDADSVQMMFRQIQARCPIIRVTLRWLAAHVLLDGCACIAAANSLAVRTGGICRVFPGKGAVIDYGTDRVSEDDARRAVKTALELQSQPCPAGQFALSVRQVMNKIAGSADDRTFRPHQA